MERGSRKVGGVGPRGIQGPTIGILADVFDPDLVNALFEFGGCAVMLLNLRAIRRDRSVRGVSLPAVGFFTAWGLWNLFYYPFLGQWLSVGAGFVLTVVQAIWLGHLIAYRKATGS